MLNISIRTSHLQARLIETLHSNPCTVPLTGVPRDKWPLSQSTTSLRLNKYIHIFMGLKKIYPASFRETYQWLKIPQSRVSPVVGYL